MKDKLGDLWLLLKSIAYAVYAIIGTLWQMAWRK